MDGKTSPANLREMEARVRSELKRLFRPEFLNRVDDTIIFHSLSEEQLARIVDIQLIRVSQRLAAQSLTLDVNAAAKKLIAREGYDPQFGARPSSAPFRTNSSIPSPPSSSTATSSPATRSKSPSKTTNSPSPAADPILAAT